MLKKFGMVSAGVTAALLASAPLAMAGDDPGDSGDGGHDHHSSHHHHGNSNGGRDGGNSNECSFRAGSEDSNVHQGDSGLLGNINVAAPVGGVVAPVLSCTNLDILNHSLDNNEINVL